MDRFGFSVLLLPLLACAGAPPAAPVAVALPSATGSAPPPPPAPPPTPPLGVPVIVAKVTKGTVADAAEAREVRVLDSRRSDESIGLLAHFAAADKPFVHEGTKMEVVFAVNPNAWREAVVEKTKETPDGSLDATLRARRYDPPSIDAIRHGAVARVYVRVQKREDRPLLRGDAVHREGGRAWVLLVREGDPPRVERREITAAGPVDPRPGPPGTPIEIAQGLQPGDAVVLDGPLGLRDGDAVQVVPGPHRTGTPKDECNPVRFVAAPDGTVLDTRLRLAWQKGLSPQLLPFAEAERTCAAAAMRLPRREEIESMYVEEMHTHTCAMDPAGDYFWSGSPGEYVGTHWMMSFNGSAPSAGGDRSTASVRCVRDVAR